MPVKRSSTRRSASGSPASRGAAVSARAAEGPLPAAAVVVAVVAATAYGGRCVALSSLGKQLNTPNRFLPAAIPPARVLQAGWARAKLPASCPKLLARQRAILDTRPFER